MEVDKEDKTVETADITDKTNVMMTSVSQNANAIGYISLGSLNDSVKALKIDGAAATVENIENGSYKISRPFNIATKSEPSEAAADFIAFILSDEGQKVVKDNGYIPVKTNGAYNGSKPSGKISIGGSSSVTPVMEKLKEAYNAVNPNVTIEINMTDSSSGMTSAGGGRVRHRHGQPRGQAERAGQGAGSHDHRDGRHRRYCQSGKHLRRADEPTRCAEHLHRRAHDLERTVEE